MRTSEQTRRMTFIVAFCFALTTGPVCAADVEIRTFRGQTMGTTYMVKIFDAPNVSDDVRFEIDLELRLVNDQMSTYLKSSEISRFNASDSTEWFEVSQETAKVVEFAQSVSKATGGAFDVTVAPSVNAWGFGPEDGPEKPLDAKTIQSLRSAIGYEKLSVRLDPPALRKAMPQLQIDLSAIAKGHGVDRIVTLLAGKGVESVFVEIGGEVRTSGDKDGKPWKVGIQVPDVVETKVLIAHAMGSGAGRDEAMATSGDYRNFFEADNVRYSHTIDPKTGEPIRNQVASVSVVSDTCMAADAWATALNVLGAEQAIEAAERNDLSAFLITRTDGGYRTMGTGTLAQYASDQAQSAVSAGNITVAAVDNGNALVPTMIAAAVVMGIIVIAMAVGVMFGRKSISGSCGGIANQTNPDGSTACALCSNPSDACKELREQMKSEATS